jgi:hypothetical protein
MTTRSDQEHTHGPSRRPSSQRADHAAAPQQRRAASTSWNAMARPPLLTFSVYEPDPPTGAEEKGHWRQRFTQADGRTGLDTDGGNGSADWVDERGRTALEIEGSKGLPGEGRSGEETDGEGRRVEGGG